MGINYTSIQPVAGIYKITNSINGKFYLGSSVNCKNRAYAHLCKLRKNKNHCLKFQNAFNKYGEESFDFEIIACVININMLTAIEQEFIDEFKPHISGYNISQTAGNTFGIKQSKKTIERKRRMAIGVLNPFYGKHHSAETKLRLSELAKTKYDGPNNPFYGQKHSDQTKAKMREIRRVKPLVCHQTGEIFESTGDASRKLKMHVRDISNCVYGRQKSTGGYTFAFVER